MREITNSFLCYYNNNMVKNASTNTINKNAQKDSAKIRNVSSDIEEYASIKIIANF